jgi:hypothetical protein
VGSSDERQGQGDRGSPFGPDAVLAERIRHNVRRSDPAERALLGFGGDAQLLADLADLHGLYAHVDLVAPAPAQPRGLGRLRRMLAPVLYPTLRRQTAHNAAATRLIAHLLDQVADQAQTIQTLEARIDRLSGDWASERAPAAGDA